jgi:predicted DNA-binding ribbon-helix-helix protein
VQYSPSLARTLQGTCAVSGLRKRSVVLAGHATSVALEPEFWAVLDRIAARRSLSKAQLLADIDAGRGRRPLASACRLLALSWVAEHGVEM